MAVRVRKYVRRKLRMERLLVVLGMLTLGIIASIFVFGSNDADSRPPHTHASSIRHLLEVTEDPGNSSGGTTAEPPNAGALYPPDTFTPTQMRKGAVVLYILGVMYMFVALAIVCDEFFVPSLEVIIQVLGISEDVAGATFMAAGGSAPELFTSIIGVFIAHSDVGVGTIVGSAVFNILFVIGMCAMFSASVLALTWWPLFRDVSFYSLSLILLIVFFKDKEIYWWEALLLLLCYALYVIFMKYNKRIEYAVKYKLMRRNRVNSTMARSTDNLIDIESPDRPSSTLPGLKAGTAKFRHGVLQLMIHTIDPLGEAKVQDKAMKLHAIASIRNGNENHNSPEAENQNANNTAGKQNGSITAISNGVLMQNGVGDKTVVTPNGRNTSQQTNTTTTTADSPANMSSGELRLQHRQPDTQSYQQQQQHQQQQQQHQPAELFSHHDNHIDNPASPGNVSDTKSQAGDGGGLQLDGNEPLDLSWPETPRKRLTYLMVAPLIFPLWLTLPDVRRPDRRKYFPWTFIGSIMWIGTFAFLMNWWASVTGRAFNIPDVVMGLTFLAAGTSIPDLITSVIVAKKGFGDMAVSSSVGSNIFDVTVGLPFPWLLYGAIEKKPYVVNSDGLFCSVLLLFLMLLFVIVSIAAFKWRMNKALGATMFVLYLVFLAISLLLEYDIIACPDVS